MPNGLLFLAGAGAGMERLKLSGSADTTDPDSEDAVDLLETGSSGGGRVRGLRASFGLLPPLGGGGEDDLLRI